MAQSSNSKAKWQSASLGIIGGELEHDQISVVRKNRDVLIQFTQVVATLNRDFFYKQLQQRVKDNLSFLHKIDSNSTSIVDEFGRSTYFYVNVGPYKILVYQPGTPTFFSSIDEGSDLVTIHDSCQQNGPILGKNCSCFLADFATHLSCMYQKNCAQQLLDAHDFHPKIYETSLETCLKMFVDEDRDVHGRLLEMKHTLLNIGGEHVVKSEHLEHYFYAKDIEVYRGRVSDAITLEEKIDLSDVSNVSFPQILEHRRRSSTYQQTESYLQMAPSSDKRKLEFIKSPSWRVIRQEILTMDKIFEDPNLARRELTNKMDAVEKEIQEPYQPGPQRKKSSTHTKKNASKDCIVM